MPEDLPAPIRRIDTFVTEDGRKVMEGVVVNEPCQRNDNQCQFVGEGSAQIRTPEGSGQISLRFPLPESKSIQEAIDAWPAAFEAAIEEKRKELLDSRNQIIIPH